MLSSEPVSVKVVVVGDGSVGKTSLLHSYTTEEFHEDYVPTIFSNCSVEIECEDIRVNLGLWDTAGQQQFGSLRPLSYSNCDVFLIVFSVVDEGSYKRAQTKWVNQLKQCAKEVPRLFVGSKIDLRNVNNPHHVQKEATEKNIKKVFNSQYFQTSALTRQGVDSLFKEATKVALVKKNIIPPVDASKDPSKKIERCCSLF